MQRGHKRPPASSKPPSSKAARTSLYVACPVCGRDVHHALVNVHLDLDCQPGADGSRAAAATNTGRRTQPTTPSLLLDKGHGHGPNLSSGPPAQMHARVVADGPAATGGPQPIAAAADAVSADAVSADAVSADAVSAAASAEEEVVSAAAADAVSAVSEAVTAAPTAALQTPTAAPIAYGQLLATPALVLLPLGPAPTPLLSPPPAAAAVAAQPSTVGVAEAAAPPAIGVAEVAEAPPAVAAVAAPLPLAAVAAAASGRPPRQQQLTWWRPHTTNTTITSSSSSTAPTSSAHTSRCCSHPELPGEWRIFDFVSQEEEQQLVGLVDAALPPWKDSTFNGPHRGKAWGVRCDLRSRRVSPEVHPLPPLLQQLVGRMQQHAPLRSFCPNEANAIDYRRGVHCLGAHVDDRQLSTDVICTLSLAGRAVMTFRKCKGPEHRVRVPLPRCCLQVLTGPSRYAYTHAIHTEDLLDPRRVSITFRCTPL